MDNYLRRDRRHWLARGGLLWTALLTLCAARCAVAQLPGAEPPGAGSPIRIPVSSWRQTFAEPASDWHRVAFDDSGWSAGEPGYGNQELPPLQQALVKTSWTTSDIWARGEFELEQVVPHLALRLSHDEDVEVYVNGVLACQRAGFIGDYVIHRLDAAAAAALRPGKNLLAVHCHQTLYGQFLDVQIVDLSALLPRRRTIDEILAELGPVPRPEHPRPDRFRPDWLNLNGVWEFAFDPQDAGRREGWHDGRTLPERIVVPFCPESLLSGVYDEGFHPYCWYARQFDVPESLRGERVLLHFGAVDYRTDVWLNGQFLGSHVGGYDPFHFDITALAQPAGNRLVLRVHDDPGEAKPRGKQSPELQPEGCIYMRVTGIWQTVWLERVGNAFLADWVLDADPATGSLAIRARIDGARPALRGVVMVSRDGVPLARGHAPVQDDAVTCTLQVPHVQAWSPEQPVLYDVELALETNDGRPVDRVQTYVGFRRIETRDGQYHLNGAPLFFASALDQGYYPTGLYTPPTDADLRGDVEWAKRYGLNGVRKHQIVAEPRFYYWCDRLGLLVWGEMADWGADLQQTDEFLRQWLACAGRDVNHPSIITWVPTNERTAPADSQMNQLKVRIYEATRAFDPTRPVIDTSGYCHTRTDVTDLHVNPPDGAACRRWWDDWRRSIAASGNFPAYPDRPAYCEGFRHEGQPVVISETGNWRITELMPMGLWMPYGYGPIPTVAEYLALYRDFFVALIAEPDCAGFSYVQLYDVEGEVNGYLTYDRKPKVPPEVIREIHTEGLRRRSDRL